MLQIFFLSAMHYRTFSQKSIDAPPTASPKFLASHHLLVVNGFEGAFSKISSTFFAKHHHFRPAATIIIRLIATTSTQQPSILPPSPSVRIALPFPQVQCHCMELWPPYTLLLLLFFDVVMINLVCKKRGFFFI